MTNTNASKDRRHFLQSSLTLGALSLSPLSHGQNTKTNKQIPTRAQAIPLKQVRLLPSPYLKALQANQAYLLRLDADRFLHNYHRFAGLAVKGKIYGGWESDTIAGEGLGHY